MYRMKKFQDSAAFSNGAGMPISIPKLNKDPETLPFIMAALYGAIDEDWHIPGTTGETITCLNHLFADRPLN